MIATKNHSWILAGVWVLNVREDEGGYWWACSGETRWGPYLTRTTALEVLRRHRETLLAELERCDLK